VKRPAYSGGDETVKELRRRKRAPAANTAAKQKRRDGQRRPFLTNHPDAAIYPGEVSAPEQDGHTFAAAHEPSLPHPGPARVATNQIN
jgi:hypothetical protein